MSNALNEMLNGIYEKVYYRRSKSLKQTDWSCSRPRSVCKAWRETRWTS